MPTADCQRRIIRIDVSMLSLKWGDVLSMLLPGAIALLALGYWSPFLENRLKSLQTVGITEGIALLIAAALLGGVLEAITRVSWEKWLVWYHPKKNILSKLNPNNLVLYERGVQSSYKYATFYANFAWAAALLLISRLFHGRKICSLSSIALVLTIVLLLVASYVQWTYYVNYQDQVFGGENATK